MPSAHWAGSGVPVLLLADVVVVVAVEVNVEVDAVAVEVEEVVAAPPDPGGPLDPGGPGGPAGPVQLNPGTDMIAHSATQIEEREQGIGSSRLVRRPHT
jgi:hypothetical protein